MSVKAGWYRDRQDPTMANYWDGEKWTGEKKPVREPVAPEGKPGKEKKRKEKTPKPPKPPKAEGEKSSSGIVKPLILVALVAAVAGGGYYAYTSMSASSDEPTVNKPSAAPTPSAEASPSAEATPTEAASPVAEMRDTINSLAIALETSRSQNNAYATDLDTLTSGGLLSPSDTVTMRVVFFDGQGNAVSPDADQTATPIVSYLICGESPEVNASYFYDSSTASLVDSIYPFGSCQQITTVGPVTWDPANVSVDVTAGGSAVDVPSDAAAPSGAVESTPAPLETLPEETPAE